MIIWWSSKKYRKYVVEIWTIHMQPLCASFLMLKFVGIYVEEFNTIFFFNHEAVDLVTNIKIVWYSMFSSGDVYPNLVTLIPCDCQTWHLTDLLLSIEQLFHGYFNSYKWQKVQKSIEQKLEKDLKRKQDSLGSEKNKESTSLTILTSSIKPRDKPKL